MLTTTVNLPTRRAPSPQIWTGDTPNDGAANGSAGVNSAPDVDAGVNSASDLGGQRCGDHEDRGDSTNYRKLAEHNLSFPFALTYDVGIASPGAGRQSKCRFPREVAEAALAHVAGDQTERAYRRGDALDKRRALMEAWANFCEPKATDVISIADRL